MAENERRTIDPGELWRVWVGELPQVIAEGDELVVIEPEEGHHG